MTEHDPYAGSLRVQAWLLSAAGLGTVAAIVVVGLLAVLQPMQALRLAAATENAALDEFLKTGPETRAQGRDLQQRLDEAESRAARQAERIPDAPHEAVFLGQVTALAHELELEIKDYRPGTVRMREKHGEMEVQFSAHGSYQALCHFLHRSTGLPRMSKVARLEVKSLPASETVEVDLTLVIYFTQPRQLNSAAGDNGHG